MVFPSIKSGVAAPVVIFAFSSAEKSGWASTNIIQNYFKRQSIMPNYLVACRRQPMCMIWRLIAVVIMDSDSNGTIIVE